MKKRSFFQQTKNSGSVFTKLFVLPTYDWHEYAKMFVTATAFQVMFASNSSAYPGAYL
jgi:hypothetical protein